MFTGIIRAITQVKKAEKQSGSLLLTFAAPKGWKIGEGDSIATNGVCLTVKKIGSGWYQTELMPETLIKTTFGVAVPTKVNLEQSLRLGDRMDGHLVAGHVDAVGKVKEVTARGQSKVYEFQFPPEFKNLLAPKGSVTVDGVSLTVVEIRKNSFTVSLVTYTLEHTNLGGKAAGDVVNLEFDILAKYIAAQHAR